MGNVAILQVGGYFAILKGICYTEGKLCVSGFQVMILRSNSCVALTLTQQSLTKVHCYNMKKIVLSLTTSSPVGLYGYGNAGQAASQVWRAMGDHRFGVREVLG